MAHVTGSEKWVKKIVSLTLQYQKGSTGSRDSYVVYQKMGRVCRELRLPDQHVYLEHLLKPALFHSHLCSRQLITLYIHPKPSNLKHVFTFAHSQCVHVYTNGYTQAYRFLS